MKDNFREKEEAAQKKKKKVISKDGGVKIGRVIQLPLCMSMAHIVQREVREARAVRRRRLGDAREKPP